MHRVPVQCTVASMKYVRALLGWGGDVTDGQVWPRTRRSLCMLGESFYMASQS